MKQAQQYYVQYSKSIQKFKMRNYGLWVIWWGGEAGGMVGGRFVVIMATPALAK